MRFKVRDFVVRAFSVKGHHRLELERGNFLKQWRVTWAFGFAGVELTKHYSDDAFVSNVKRRLRLRWMGEVQ